MRRELAKAVTAATPGGRGRRKLKRLLKADKAKREQLLGAYRGLPKPVPLGDGTHMGAASYAKAKTT